jgi:hypothetical protein
MPNAIKYNTSVETLALKKGNFYIGTGDVGKGPTSSTGYYNGITPPSGGYTIYLNKETGGPSIYTVNTEAQLTGLTSSIAGQTLTTSGACLNWFATQTDKMIFNIDYPAIVTSGLVLSYDAGFTPSYPTTGTTWYDMGPSGKTQTLYNGPTYSNGSIVFDGVDDYTSIPSINGPSLQTIELFFNANSTSSKTLFVGTPVYRPRISLRNNVVNVYYGMETGTGDIAFRFNSISTTQFYQLVYTYSGSTNHKCYLNTVEGTRTSNGTSLNGIPNFTGLDFGVNAGSEGPFNGKISIFRLYDRVLTSDEIQQNYIVTKSNFSLDLQILVVAGAGGGGRGVGNNRGGGGGGAGGLQYFSANTTFIKNTNYTITLGAGGAAGVSLGSFGSNGNNSVFGSITSNGGGGGAGAQNATPNGLNGGSGGGASSWGNGNPTPSYGIGGSGISGQGFSGGSITGIDSTVGSIGSFGAGGGGAGGVGGNGTYGGTFGAVGSGLTYNISGTNTIYSQGGLGGGFTTNESGANGLTNRGYGGGGTRGGNNATAGSGGSGIIMFKLPYNVTVAFSNGVTWSSSTSNFLTTYVVTATSTTSETVSFS